MDKLSLLSIKCFPFIFFSLFLSFEMLLERKSDSMYNILAFNFNIHNLWKHCLKMNFKATLKIKDSTSVGSFLLAFL